jgi:hypothetical protein
LPVELAILRRRISASTTSGPDFGKNSPADRQEPNKMSRVIKMSTPKRKPASLPKTAALTKAQADHKKWLKAHGIKVTKNTLRT